MTDTPLFVLARADHTIIVTPQRNLTEFDFAQIETEGARVLGQISKDGGPNVVVDFSKIDYTGSTALSFFTRLFKKTRCRGGEMAFCNVSPAEQDVLRITRLDTLWPICDSLDDALQKVNSDVRHTADVTWIVVADRAIARIFEQCGGSDSELQAVSTLRHPQSRERMSDGVTDGPGSFRGGGITGSESGDQKQDHRHHTAEDFAREVAAHLDEARQRGQFGHVILVAAPLFLGELRNALSPPLSHLVEHELAKDYTHLDGATISKHISELAATT
ncbi:MAG: anti-anti-sigma factor [Planctomycetaceae bacterium]|jgi:anti-anti-sigma factor